VPNVFHVSFTSQSQVHKAFLRAIFFAPVGHWLNVLDLDVDMDLDLAPAWMLNL